MKRYAVIGNPIGHSLSSNMHNAAFKELGVNAVYEALEVERLDRVYPHLRKTYSGINVTIPHKVTIIDLIDEKEMAADLVGAVNCVRFEEGGKKAVGYNTDLYGAVEALKTKVTKLKNMKILVLGAGGAARAIIYGCLMDGAEISVHNRTNETADELAKETEEKISKCINVLKEINLKKFDILINATSVGMYPKLDETPLTSSIPSNMVVMDIIYNPLETKLLKQARESGATTISGLEMFVQQGAESLRIWGYEPPIDVMRIAVLNALNKKSLNMKEH